MNKKQLEKFKEVKEYIDSIGYELLQDYYENNKTKLKLRCENGHECEITWGNIISGKRCKQCALNKHKTSIEDIVKLVESEGYTFIKELEGFKERRILIRCPEGHEYDVNLGKFKLGRRCPKCKDTTFDYSFVKEYIEKEGYKLLTDNYINVFQKLILECPKGHKFEITFHNFKNGGNRCPRCKSSKGEKEITVILNNENIKYETQKTFKDCKDKKILPFDFYLPDYNLIIEYDGEQHFDIKHSFDGEKGFGETILHDAIKNSYCEDNNINILRIPFWKFDDIENLIKEKLIILRENFND